MKIVFLPQSGNPYLKLLKKGLTGLGQEINDEMPFSYLNLIRDISSYKPDIIHFHWLHRFMIGNTWFKTFIKSVLFLITIIILKIRMYKIIWTIHNIKNHENKYITTEKLIISIFTKLCNSIIVHCKYAQSEAMQYYGINDPGKIHIIPHGNFIEYYDNSFSKDIARHQLHYDKNNIVLLAIGKIRSYKGIPELIDAFKTVRDDNIRLIVAGKSNNEEIHNSIINKIYEDPRITYVSHYIEDIDIQKYMNCSDIVVFPYRDILTSGGILLAMSFAKAILAPALGCIPELLDKTGSVVYDTSNKNGLKEAIENALYMDLNEMGKHNYKIVQKHSWSDVALSTLKVYKQ